MERTGIRLNRNLLTNFYWLYLFIYLLNVLFVFALQKSNNKNTTIGHSAKRLQTLLDALHWTHKRFQNILH